MEMLQRLYQSMLLIRRVEEFIADIYPTDAVKSPVHLSIGQEAVAVGVCDVLAMNDVIAHTYRCHASYLAKGGDLNQMMAELYGKRGGCAGGKAGSMHLVDIKNGILGASAVVGTTIPIAAGYAFALQQEQKKTGHQRIAAVFFGDGATEEGCFMETMNFAALHRLPLIFICENNKLAIHTPIEKRWASQDICARVATFGVETHRISTGDVLTIREIMQTAVDKIRQQATSGPIFIECMTYRWKEHVGPRDDHHHTYRDSEEFAWWQENDAISALASQLPAAVERVISQRVDTLIADARQFAEQSPYPTAEELYTHVYA